MILLTISLYIILGIIYSCTRSKYYSYIMFADDLIINSEPVILDILDWFFIPVLLVFMIILSIIIIRRKIKPKNKRK